MGMTEESSTVPVQPVSCPLNPSGLTCQSTSSASTHDYPVQDFVIHGNVLKSALIRLQFASFAVIRSLLVGTFNAPVVMHHPTPPALPGWLAVR